MLSWSRSYPVIFGQFTTSLIIHKKIKFCNYFQIYPSLMTFVRHFDSYFPRFLVIFIRRMEIRSISSRGLIEVSFHLLNFGLERVYWTSKTYMVYRVFFARKCFIPRREIRSISSRGPIDTLSIYFLRERILHFQK